MIGMRIQFLCFNRFGAYNRQARSAAFVGIFIPVQNLTEITRTKATSHLQEDSMSSLSSSVQLLEQVLIETFR